MDEPFLVRMLNRMANFDEQFETLMEIKVVLVAVSSDWDPPHEIHDKKWPPGFRRSCIQYLCDVRVIH
jgi:hypothetical protein